MCQTVIELAEGWMIRCPRCGHHVYPKTGRPGATWTFNGDRVRPTFLPSMNETVGPYPEGHPHAGQIRRCHFTITDGQITYHNDCSHDLRGTYPLEAWPPEQVHLYAALLAEAQKPQEPPCA